jgi:orotate phosphoribosyltransferase
MDVALREGTIQEEEMELLRSWRQDPASFGK